MSLPNVKINIERSGLGGVAITNDNVMGLCLTGVAVADKLSLDTPYSIYSVDDLADLGITAIGDNSFAYKQVKEFYDEAPLGAKLWIILSASTVKISDMVDKSQAGCQAKKLQQAAQGEIRVIGACWKPASGYYAPETPPTILDGLDAKTWMAVTNADALASDLISEITPVTFLIQAIGYTGVADDLRALTGMTNARVGIVLAGTASDGVASVGLVLGRLAKIPVQRKISRVKDGALNTLYGYLTDNTSIEEAGGDIGTIHDKGYIILRKFPTKSGYYFNGDHTCAAATDDLHTIANNRVINKATIITYNTYVEEVDEEIEVTEDGNLDPGMIAYLQAKIENAINLNMAGEISNFEAYIDPAQNILSVPRLNIVLRITPVGYMSEIIVSLGFKNPSLKN